MRPSLLLLVLAAMLISPGCKPESPPAPATAAATTAGAVSATELTMTVNVKSRDLPAKELAQLFCHVKIMPNAEVATVEGYSSSIAEDGKATVHIPAASITRAPREVIVNIEPSEKRPYAAEAKLQLDASVWQKPLAPITLNLAKIVTVHG